MMVEKIVDEIKLKSDAVAAMKKEAYDKAVTSAYNHLTLGEIPPTLPEVERRVSSAMGMPVGGKATEVAWDALRRFGLSIQEIQHSAGVFPTGEIDGGEILKNTGDTLHVRAVEGFYRASVDEDSGGYSMGGSWGVEEDAADDGWYDLHEYECAHAKKHPSECHDDQGVWIWESKEAAVKALQGCLMEMLKDKWFTHTPVDA